MTTKIYGASDDLIEVEGDIKGEISVYGTEDDEHGVLLICSDGTMLEAKFGKLDLSLWGITLLKEGNLYDKTHLVDANEDADPNSDVIYLKDGITSIIAAKEWENVK